MRKYKYWDLKQCDQTQVDALAARLGISPVTAGILWNRGLQDEQEIRDFLFCKEERYYDPFLMKDMGKAAARIMDAVAAHEKIAVYGDYDVDGITASSLLYLYLMEKGANVSTYIPKREGEGYGLNREALRLLFDEGITLVVTVDCGISGVKEVAEAPRGMDIIITDHHRPPEVLPDACAVVNPKRMDCDYPFKGLSGVGVAFKLCQALEKLQNQEGLLWEKYTELAALGTVADIVPLQDENRVLVKDGMKSMATTSLTGLRKLLEVCHCNTEVITTEKIGFVLAPRLNASGRLEHAQQAVELLITKDEAAAEAMAENLNNENVARQEFSRQIFEEAEELLKQQGKIGPAIVLAGEWDSETQTGWHPGVIGIVASRLVDKYYRPVILISITGETAKGSCRSIPPLDLYDAIDVCSEDLIQFGGHSQAAGLTLERDKIEAFRLHFTEVVQNTLKPEDFQPHLSVDVEWDVHKEMTLGFLHELQLLEPFGCENPAPLFMIRNVELHNPRLFGQENNHLRFFADIGYRSCHCIMWQGAPYQFCLTNNTVADIAFKPRINVFNGMESINLDVAAFRMDLELHDYRKSQEFKESVLKKILNSGNQFTVFINKGNLEENALLQFPNIAKIRYYGDVCKEDETSVIFYDLPQIDIYKLETFPIINQHGVELYILYNKYDKLKLREEYSDEAGLKSHLNEVSWFIQKVLHSQTGALIEQLINQARTYYSINITKEDIQILHEINFFEINEEIILKGTKQRKLLKESPTYDRLNKEKKALSEVYMKCLQINCARIQSLKRK